jgi:uncharacterized protein YjbI with pentapeptide repeats
MSLKTLLCWQAETHLMLRYTSIVTIAAVAICFAIGSPAMAACNDREKAGVNWQGCDKSKAKLEAADLSKANLEGANLSGADLFAADLSGANLRAANLTGANLSMANLTGANLALAILRGARLATDTITEVKTLSGADLSGATWHDGRICAARSIGRCN